MMSRFNRQRRALGLPALNSLRIQLILWIALPVAVSLLAISMAEIQGHEQAMTQMVQQQANLVARSLGVLIDGHIDQRQGLLLQLASEYGSATGARPETEARFAAGLTLIGPKSDPSAAQPEWAASEAVLALANEVQSSRVPGLATVYDDASQGWLLVQAVPILGAGDNSLVLAGAEPVSGLITEHLIASLDPSLIDEVRLTTTDGALLFAQPEDTTSVAARSVDPSHDGHGLARWVTGQTTVLPTGWQVTVVKDWRDLVPPVLTFGNTALVVVIVATILSLLSAYFGLRNIVWPLQKLDQAVAQVGWGNYSAIQQPVGGVSEIEELRLALARMTEQVRQYQQELQSYIGAMTLGQEEERRRLARDLHDATVQDLIALNQRVEMVERELTRDPQRATTRLQELRPQITAIIDGLRRQIHALRPLYLEDLGFIPALEMLVRDIGQRHQLATAFRVTGDEDTQPSLPVQISAFRIAQEALQNVVKHAHATQVDVSLCLDDSHLTLRIADNGSGFAVPSRPNYLAQEGHFGLLGMKERAQLHSGALQIESQAGLGTTVSVRFPLDEPATPLALITQPTAQLQQ
ncbi:MAG: sensor histidine kinase [Caldilineaceae bacterium]|nr:sensor histidine kinase [Caldilineaceae bacterium]